MVEYFREIIAIKLKLNILCIYINIYSYLMNKETIYKVNIALFIFYQLN